MSDESPPAALRYQGLRFQITITYAVFFEPRNNWDNNQYDDTMPITVQANICDVVNCSRKTGT